MFVVIVLNTQLSGTHLRKAGAASTYSVVVLFSFEIMIS